MEIDDALPFGVLSVPVRGDGKYGEVRVSSATARAVIRLLVGAHRIESVVTLDGHLNEGQREQLAEWAAGIDSLLRDRRSRQALQEPRQSASHWGFHSGGL